MKTRIAWAALAAFFAFVLVMIGAHVALAPLVAVLLVEFIEWRWRTKKSKQTTFVYCPGCGKELCGTGPEVQWWHDDQGFVHYACTCGLHSTWDFDMPAPVLLRHTEKS